METLQWKTSAEEREVMVKKILIILTFLICFTNPSLSQTKCKYYSEADVVNGELVNKKDHKYNLQMFHRNKIT